MGRLTEPPLRHLVLRLAAVYAMSALMGQLFLHLQERLLDYATHAAAPAGTSRTGTALLAAAAGVGLTAALTAFLLRPASPGPAGGGQAAHKRNDRLLEITIRLPYIAALTMAGFVFLAGFGLREAGWFGPAPYGSPEASGAIDAWLPLSGDAAAGLTAGLILFYPARRMVRRAVRLPGRLSKPLGRRTSLFVPLAFTYAGIAALAILGLVRMTEAVRLAGTPLTTGRLAAAAASYGLIGLIMLGMAALEARRDLIAMIRSLRKLVQGSEEQLAEYMPVLSRDEAGELSLAFNELHERIAAEYEELQRELILAGRVQQKLLPPGDLRFGASRVAAKCSSASELGGDFYDAVTVDDEHFALLIGDVSGKGVPAALVVSALLVKFRSEIKRGGGAGEVLERMNRLLYDAIGEAGTVTAGLAIVNSRTGRLRYASAGHPAPYLLRKDGAMESPDLPALPIGFNPEQRYPEAEYSLAPGDRLVMYTDGIIEAMDGARGLYGFDRFERDVLAWNAETSPQEWVEELFGSLDRRRGRAAADDRTLLALVFQPAGDAPDASRTGGIHRKWTFPSVVNGERTMLDELAAAVRNVWPRTDRLDDIGSAVAEAAINAAEHGNRLNPEIPVTVDVHIGGHLLVCRIYDRGGGFTPKFAAGGIPVQRPGDRNQSGDPRGWGLPLMNALADYWGTGRSEQGFYIELFFLRKEEADRQRG